MFSSCLILSHSYAHSASSEVLRTSSSVPAHSPLLLELLLSFFVHITKFQIISEELQNFKEWNFSREWEKDRNSKSIRGREKSGKIHTFDSDNIIFVAVERHLNMKQ